MNFMKRRTYIREKWKRWVKKIYLFRDVWDIIYVSLSEVLITGDLSVTVCWHREWIILLISKYEIIRDRARTHPSLGSDGRLSADVHLSYSLAHFPLPIPIASASPVSIVPISDETVPLLITNRNPR